MRGHTVPCSGGVRMVDRMVDFLRALQSSGGSSCLRGGVVRADRDLSSRTFEGTPASEDEEFKMEVDRKLLYLD